MCSCRTKEIFFFENLFLNYFGFFPFEYPNQIYFCQDERSEVLVTYLWMTVVSTYTILFHYPSMYVSIMFTNICGADF